MERIKSEKILKLTPLACVLIAVSLYLILKSSRLFSISCPVTYLNPWQYFFYCTGFEIAVCITVGIAALLLFFLAKNILFKKKV